MKYLHRAWVEINLDALIHNLKEIKAATSSKVWCVVKANAYGHAVDLTAKLLEENGAEGFAVSNIEEAKELRVLGITAPIIILGYTPASYAEELIRFGIIQTVFSLEYAIELNEVAKSLGQQIEAHIKLDTGMGRIGFNCRSDSLDGLEEAKKALELEFLNFNGAFTHFPSADSCELDDEEATRAQFSRFVRATELLGAPFKMLHCCNSAATMLYPDMHLDAVRAGIILYGLTPSADITPTLPLQQVMTFKSTISMVKMLDKGETVSYGMTYTAEKPKKIATISAGYADGYPRLLSSRGEVLVCGKKAKVVGRVCMDQFCIDVTDIEGVKEGDTVLLFGDKVSIDSLAKAAETINYEIICGISKRVPRVYIKDGKELDI